MPLPTPRFPSPKSFCAVFIAYKRACRQANLKPAVVNKERVKEEKRAFIISRAMQTKQIAAGRESQLLPPKKDQGLRRVYSDVAAIVPDIIIKDLNQANKTSTDQEDKVKCECCGMSEDCTPTYIGRIKAFFCGKWVCGLCAEAVNEKMKRAPALTIEEALESHAALCKQFNGTRLNPKLSLASAMREIARKSSQSRSISNDQCGLPKIGRTMSCIPRIDGC